MTSEARSLAIARAAVLTLLFLATFVPALGESSPVECYSYTYTEAISVGEFYVHAGFQEVWQEANDIPGLQRQQTICEDGSSIPKDVCITHKQYYAQIACLMLYPGTL